MSKTHTSKGPVFWILLSLVGLTPIAVIVGLAICYGPMAEQRAVVAVVNGDEIADYELITATSGSQPVRGEYAVSTSPLESLIGERLLAQEAVRQGLSVSDEELRRSLLEDSRLAGALNQRSEYETRVWNEFERPIPRFENDYRRRLLIEKLNIGEEERAALAQRLRQTAEVSLLRDENAPHPR